MPTHWGKPEPKEDGFDGDQHPMIASVISLAKVTVEEVPQIYGLAKHPDGAAPLMHIIMQATALACRESDNFKTLLEESLTELRDMKEKDFKNPTSGWRTVQVIDRLAQVFVDTGDFVFNKDELYERMGGREFVHEQMRKMGLTPPED